MITIAAASKMSLPGRLIRGRTLWQQAWENSAI